MGQRSSKHLTETGVHIVPTGGLNLVGGPADISDNELRRAHNLVYSPETGKLRVRPGFRFWKWRPAIGVYFQNMFWYSAQDLIIGQASNHGLYSSPATPGGSWTQIATVDGTTAFIEFNGKLIFADGELLRSWDGTTFESLADGVKPNAIVEMDGRIVINDTADKDAVWFSKPYDETGWDTNDGAVFIRCGYGDGLYVNGLAYIGHDLIVSKDGHAQRIYRIMTAGSSDQWQVTKLIDRASCESPLAIEAIHSDVLFLDKGKLKNISAVQQYGDLKLFSLGAKINTEMSKRWFDGEDARFIRHIPALDQVWMSYGNDVFIYHISSQAFTTVSLAKKRITSVLNTMDNVIVSSEVGHCYIVDETLFEDELEQGVRISFEGIMRTKEFRFPMAEAIIKRIQMSFEAITEGNGLIEVVVTGGRSLGYLPITYRAVKLYYGSADMTYGDMDTLYGLSGGAYDWIDNAWNRIRLPGFSIQFRSIHGRAGVEDINVKIAGVNG